MKTPSLFLMMLNLVSMVAFAGGGGNGEPPDYCEPNPVYIKFNACRITQLGPLDSVVIELSPVLKRDVYNFLQVGTEIELWGCYTKLNRQQDGRILKFKTPNGSEIAQREFKAGYGGSYYFGYLAPLDMEVTLLNMDMFTDGEYAGMFKVIASYAPDENGRATKISYLAKGTCTPIFPR